MGDPGDPFDLLEGEDLGTGKPGDALFGHAVDAAQVAAVGDRDTQVGVDAAEGVDEGPARRHTRGRRSLARERDRDGLDGAVHVDSLVLDRSS